MEEMGPEDNAQGAWKDQNLTANPMLFSHRLDHKITQYNTS